MRRLVRDNVKFEDNNNEEQAAGGPELGANYIACAGSITLCRPYHLPIYPELERPFSVAI